MSFCYFRIREIYDKYLEKYEVKINQYHYSVDIYRVVNTYIMLNKINEIKVCAQLCCLIQRYQLVFSQQIFYQAGFFLLQDQQVRKLQASVLFPSLRCNKVSYDGDFVKHKAQASGMGYGKRSNFTECKTVSPGASKYNLVSELQTNKKKSRGSTMGLGRDVHILLFSPSSSTNIFPGKLKKFLLQAITIMIKPIARELHLLPCAARPR